MMKKVLNKGLNRKGIDSINTFPNLFVKILLAIIILLFLILLMIPMNVLLAYEFETNNYLKSWDIKEGERFTVHYIHSVELCPVSESYIIKEGNIILTETYFESYGAGLPASTNHKFEITGSGFRIYDIDEKMENLVYRAGAEGTDPKINLRNDDYRFLDFSRPRGAIGFKVKQISLLTYIVREVIK